MQFFEAHTSITCFSFSPPFIKRLKSLLSQPFIKQSSHFFSESSYGIYLQVYKKKETLIQPQGSIIQTI